MTLAMARFAVVLGLLCAIGPVAVDMYLPAMPSMARALGASPAEIQASLTTFFLGLAGGQLIFGPVSDVVGRKPPIYAGVILFVLAGAVCATATDAQVMTTARLAQGLGASVGFAVAPAVIRDRYQGAAYARLFALCVLMLGLGPVLAPLVGSLILEVASWRWIFWATVTLGLIGLLLTLVLLPETLPKEARSSAGPRAAFATYAALARDRRFMGLAIANAVAQGAFFAYLAGSSFVLIETYGLSPMAFSIAFGVNAIGLIGGAQVAPNLMRRFGPKRLILGASAVLAAATALLLVLELSGLNGLWLMLPIFFVILTAISQIGAPSMALAMADWGKAAGAASAVLGSLQIGSGAVMSGVVAALANGTPLPMVASVAACGVGAFGLFVLALRGRD